MNILGIETSCDESAIAVLKVNDQNFEVLSSIISSQVEVHRKYGGVVPTLAKREHQRNLSIVLRKALLEAGILEKNKKPYGEHGIHQKIIGIKKILEREQGLSKKMIPLLRNHQNPDIDVIAVTIGLGLEPALWVGINFAKALAYFWEKPIVPVSHVEGHILVNFLNKPVKDVVCPALCLTVSGGHTMLVLMNGIGKYKIIGETRDDSAGECFDKTARLLGLGYPGGPAIAAAANRALPRYERQINLPRPMLHSKDFDFSFSGLKTAVLYHHRSQPPLRGEPRPASRGGLPRVQKSKNYVSAMAAEIQQAIIDVLIVKTIRAAKEYRVKTVMIGGGVAANTELRAQLQRKLEKELPEARYAAPDAKLCTDNGVMAAMAGYFSWQRLKGRKSAGKSIWSIKANSNMKF